MILDSILSLLAGVLDGWISKLPGFKAEWPIAAALADISALLRVIWLLFPPLATAGAVLVAGLGVEAFLIGWYWVNWLVKKIPFIG